jgi:hypothetical protein
LELVIGFVGAGMIGLIREQIPATDQFVAPYWGIPADGSLFLFVKTR